MRATKLVGNPKSPRLLSLEIARDGAGNELVRVGTRRLHAIEGLGRAGGLDGVVGVAIFLLFSNRRLSISQTHAGHLRGEGVGTGLSKASLVALILRRPIASSHSSRSSHGRWTLIWLLRVIRSRSSIARSLLLLVGWLARNIRSIRVVGVGVEALAKGMILRIVGHSHEKAEKSPRG